MHNMGVTFEYRRSQIMSPLGQWQYNSENFTTIIYDSHLS